MNIIWKIMKIIARLKRSRFEIIRKLVEVLDGTLVRYLFKEFAEGGQVAIHSMATERNNLKNQIVQKHPETSCDLLIQIPLDERLRLDLGATVHQPIIQVYPPGAPVIWMILGFGGRQLHQLQSENTGVWFGIPLLNMDKILNNPGDFPKPGTGSSKWMEILMTLVGPGATEDARNLRCPRYSFPSTAPKSRPPNWWLQRPLGCRFHTWKCPKMNQEIKAECKICNLYAYHCRKRCKMRHCGW